MKLAKDRREEVIYRGDWGRGEKDRARSAGAVLEIK
jgi:hypothetical protein